MVPGMIQEFWGEKEMRPLCLILPSVGTSSPRIIMSRELWDRRVHIFRSFVGTIGDKCVYRSMWLTFPAPVDPATASIFPFSRYRLMFLRTGVTYRLVKKSPGSLAMCPFALFSCLIFSNNSLIPCGRNVHVCTEQEDNVSNDTCFVPFHRSAFIRARGSETPAVRNNRSSSRTLTLSHSLTMAWFHYNLCKH